jgi:hypothetical protein
MTTKKRGKSDAARRFANSPQSLTRIASFTMRDENRPRGVREQAAAADLARYCEVPPNQIDACKRIAIGLQDAASGEPGAGDSRAGLAVANAAQRIERVAQDLNASSRK